MLKRKMLRSLSMALVFVFMFSAVAMAAMPANTVIFGDKAYDLSLLDDASMSEEILAAFTANSNTFVYKTLAGKYMDPNAADIDPATLPALTYKGADKVEQEIGAGDTDPAEDPEVPVGDLKVESVSAIDATTVEVTFNKAVTAADNLSFTFNGVAVAASKVAYAGSKATLTVGTMTFGTEYTVAVTDGDEFTATEAFTYGITEPATLDIDQTVYNAQVGTNVTLNFVVNDDQGEPKADEDVFIRLHSYNAVGGATIPATEHTVTTDENGIASLTFTRAEPTAAAQAVTAYVVSKPVVRNTSVTINWSIAATGLVDVNDVTAKTLGIGTVRDFTVTVKNTDGTAKTNGLVMVDFNAAAGTVETDFALYVRDLSVTDETAANAWAATQSAGLDDTTNGTTADYVLTLNNTGAGQNTTAQGVVNFRLVGLAAKTVVPTFYTNSTDTDAAITENDPSAVAGSTTYVAQTPTITMTAVNDITTIATAAADLGTTAEKAANQFKLYDLSVVDQYGNPYRGTVKVADYRQVDNNGITAPIATNTKFKADTTGDGNYDMGQTNLNTTITPISFAYDATLAGVDKNNDSSMRIAVYNVNDGEENFKLAVWADTATGAGTSVNQIDATEANAIGETLKFADRALETINVAAVEGTETAPNGSLLFTASLYDQFGDKKLAVTTLDAAVALKSSGALETDETNFTVNASNTASTATDSYTTTMDLTADAAINLGGITDTNVVKLKVGAKAVAPKDDWTLIIFDNTGGAAFNGTQTAGAADFTIVDETYAAMDLAVATNNDADVKEAGENIYVSDLAGDDAVKFTYSKVDQAGTAVASGTEEVAFAITNTGNSAVQVDVDGAGNVSLAAGSTGEYTANLTAGTVDVVVTGVDAKKNKIEFSATSAALANSDVQATLYYYNKEAATEVNEFNGTIVAVDTSSGAGNAANFFVVNTTVGFVKVDYADAATFDGTITYKVDGSVVASATALEDYLEAGYIVKVTTDNSSTNDITVEVTTN